MPLSGFIKKQIALYKGLKSCYCPALKEKVYFTSVGIKHLLYKKNRPRSHSSRHNRVHLVSHIVEVIENSETAVIRGDSNNPTITRWSLKHSVIGEDGKQVVKVILEKKPSGKIIFLSTMRKMVN